MRYAMILAGVLAVTGVARAQVSDPPPFFSDAGIGLFDPTIEVVNSGTILDAHAVVSHDRMYVTINMRPTNTKLLALQTFAVQRGPSLGFVGSGGGASLLDRTGVTRLSP
jgi:hypothetical protein